MRECVCVGHAEHSTRSGIVLGVCVGPNSTAPGYWGCGVFVVRPVACTSGVPVCLHNVCPVSCAKRANMHLR